MNMSYVLAIYYNITIRFDYVSSSIPQIICLLLHTSVFLSDAVSTCHMRSITHILPTYSFSMIRLFDDD